jgi:hypothetical protein
VCEGLLRSYGEEALKLRSAIRERKDIESTLGNQDPHHQIHPIAAPYRFGSRMEKAAPAPFSRLAADTVPPF